MFYFAVFTISYRFRSPVYATQLISMHEIPLNAVLLPSFFIGLSGWYICRRLIGLNPVVSAGIALIKISIPFIFFYFFYYDGIIQFDDYLGRCKVYFEGVDNPFACFFHDSLRSKMFSPRHNSLYIWWNFFGTWLFGDWYSSPVFLNVGLTFIGGLFIYRIALLSGFSPVYSRALSGFYLLHWDVIAWSSFPNLKEIMIQVLTMGAWYGAVLLNRSESRFRGFILFCFMLSILLFSRYHIPFFIVFSYILYTVICKKDIINYLIAFAVGLTTFFVFPEYVFDRFIRYLANLNTFFFYFLKFILSPQPWALSQKNFWQFFSSILHLLFLGPCIWGMLSMWKNRVVRQFILYVIVLLIFYSFLAYGEQRQRVQVGWVVVWAQFHFIHWYNRLMFSRTKV